MCSSIWVADQDREVDCVSDLKVLVGSDNIVWAADVTGYYPENACLCIVNVPATLIEHGFKVWRDPCGDPMQYSCEALERDE